MRIGLKVKNEKVLFSSFNVNIPDRSYNDSILVLGGSGLGKSKLAELLISKRRENEVFDPVFIFDPKGDFLKNYHSWYSTKDVITKLDLKKDVFTPLFFNYEDVSENFLFEILKLKRDRQYSVIISNYFAIADRFQFETFRDFLMEERDKIEEKNKKRSYSVLIDSMPLLERTSILGWEGINIEDFFMNNSVNVFYFPFDNIEKYACASLLLEKILNYSLRNKRYPLIVCDELSLFTQNEYFNETMKFCINSCRGYRSFIGITQNLSDLPDFFHNEDNFMFHAKFEKKENFTRRLVKINDFYCFVDSV